MGVFFLSLNSLHLSLSFSLGSPRRLLLAASHDVLSRLRLLSGVAVDDGPAVTEETEEEEEEEEGRGFSGEGLFLVLEGDTKSSSEPETDEFFRDSGEFLPSLFSSALLHVEELKLPACSSPRSSARVSTDATEILLDA